MSDDFTRATWRASKKRRLRKRTKPWGGRKTAPPAFLEAAKLNQFKPGRPGHRVCSATQRNGSSMHPPRPQRHECLRSTRRLRLTRHSRQAAVNRQGQRPYRRPAPRKQRPTAAAKRAHPTSPSTDRLTSGPGSGSPAPSILLHGSASSDRSHTLINRPFRLKGGLALARRAIGRLGPRGRE